MSVMESFPHTALSSKKTSHLITPPADDHHEEDSKAQFYSKFITEVIKRSRCSLECLKVCLYYMSKLTSSHVGCPKRAFLACLCLSFKYIYDSTVKLKTWSKISGLSPGELKSLEMTVLVALDYNLNLHGDYDVVKTVAAGPKRRNDGEETNTTTMKRLRLH
ncbi:Cyclin, interacts with Pho85p cyclin-dependent kinase (Cdk), induced by Gcn4p at level of transcript [Cyberlindnera jadinii]|uniref:Cyclin, interacts with Pho85p cyclin-dependent kinase (Cdk), induced by Gcn4p at level of transcript n=1 Tax=Cyberlindnera jadinii (strain ATCC 18201 / CBS 1600 / BCRC 20928 / JCM 3617 / NBRC 0987 / NRRL Y-1542) TaxID=983966 RepID=A0A0H5C2U2_CYBJN|nr:Cyclin, interacts with Pho85p cyclin-dependent kinase (Cdk), induced by Gcn4p at level of transcript [Cyberlindnera jadinii]